MTGGMPIAAMPPRLLVAAGGTGGHVFPALAVAQELHHRGWHAEWVGTDRGLEVRVIPAAGFGLHILKFSGLRGKGAMAWLSLPVRLLAALMQARSIVLRVRPDAVVAFGGYVTFPVGLMARMMGIPLCVHEQNAVMGTANRWLARIARAVLISFASTRHAPADAVVVGNPVRESICALSDPAHRYTERSGPLRVLIVGGSLGAQALNRALPEALAGLSDQGQPLLIRHQTGAAALAEVQAAYARHGVQAQCSAFINDMESAYGWADVMICRAGASTVAEVAAAGVAAIFVPLPSAIDDHQSANARVLADAQAAWCVPQTPQMPARVVEILRQSTRQSLMDCAVRARQLQMQDAAQRAAAIVERVALRSSRTSETVA